MIPALQFDNFQWLSLQPRHARRAVGGLAVPPGRVGEPQARRGHDGHADQRRHARRVAVVAVRAVPRRRRHERHADGVRPDPRAGEGADQIYLETAGIVTTFLLAGRYFEARAKRRAGAALTALLELGAKDVAVARRRRRRAPHPRRASSRSATASSCAPARRSPPTASSRRAASAVDMSMLTGESVPVEVAPGAEIAGATVNAGGRLVVRATRVGADTALAQIARLVEDAQTGKAPVQRLADRVSGVFVPVVIALAVATLGFWLGTGESGHVRVHRRRRRADHRLPLRARAGHADGADGRHRPRRPARPAHQGPRGPGVHAPASTPSCSTRPAP